jgi:hypothetical protein
VAVKRFRYRKLSAGGDRQVAAGHGAFGMLSAQAGAVHTVNADEGEASRDELEKMLRAGKIAPSDLVFSEGRWVTFTEAPEFYEVAVATPDRKRAGFQRKAFVLGVIGVAFVALVLFVRLLTG